MILSKIDYGSVVYQNVQKILAGYVLNRYANKCDVIKLGWLPIVVRFEFNRTKLAFKTLHCQEWPYYLLSKFHKYRNSDDYKLPYVKDKNTFKSEVLMIFHKI